MRSVLLVRSSVDGWALRFDASGQVNLINLPAGERAFTAISSATGEFAAARGTGISAVAPSGHVLTLASDTAVMAVDVFEPNCVVAGVVTSIKGKLP